jgi:hypothetical protein
MGSSFEDFSRFPACFTFHGVQCSASLPDHTGIPEIMAFSFLLLQKHKRC